VFERLEDRKQLETLKKKAAETCPCQEVITLYKCAGEIAATPGENVIS
jgi:hypothetical protein